MQIRVNRNFLHTIFNNSKLYLIISAVVITLLLVIGYLNGKFWGMDFEVYYYAAKSFFSGNQVYGIAYGSSEVGFYKYSPFVLLLYAPASLLPFHLAAMLNYIFLSLTMIMAILSSSYLVVKVIFGEKNNIGNKILLIVFFLSLTFLNRDLLMGNVNALLLLLICLALFLTRKSKPIIAGLLLAIAILFKPYLLIVVLPLLGNKKFKTFLSTLVFLLGLSLLPLLFTGWSVGNQLYHNWIAALLEHDTYIVSPFTFDSLIKNYLLPSSTFNFTIYAIALVVFIYGLIKLIIRLPASRFEFPVSSNRLLFMESFILLALIPNLVNTDTQQLLYTIPLVAFLIQYIIVKPKWYLLIIYVIVFFFFSVDQPDILGKSLSQAFYQMGLSGLSNLIIVFLSVFIFVLEGRRIFANDSPDFITDSRIEQSK